MSKRKLNRRQNWRIEKIQKERETRALKRAEQAESKLNETDLGTEELGVVMAHYGVQIDVENPETGDISRCHIRANIPQLVTGDRVVFRQGNPTGVVVALRERDNILQRPDQRGQLKQVAANIDHLLVVIAPYPEAHPNLIDRYLVAAESMGIEPVLLLNKMDRIDPDKHGKLLELMAMYTKLGYNTVNASAVSQEGLADLKQFLVNKTTVFVGQSGVGKSSLINLLLPEANMKVGALSEASQKGRHTTTTAKLFHFPDGGDLIDSPGIREFALWHFNETDVYEGFKEITPYLGQCKFRDCHHNKEPGCEVRNALERGDISESRWRSCQHIINTLGDPRAT